MTDIGSSRSTADTSRVAYGTEPDPTGWTGWIVFASCMMFLVGTVQAIQGFVAIFDPGYYHVTEGGLVIDVDYTAWGWAHLLLGALLILCAVGLIAGNIAARIVAVVLAGLSALVNLLFIEAYPFWSIIVITIDVLVIYAVTAHGRELKGSRM